MLGAIAGDVIGSQFEGRPVKRTGFALFTARCKFTDDTVMTAAVADCLLHGKAYATAFKEWGRKYPDAGYGGNFASWLFSEDAAPYYSFGNGSAMRVSPVGWACETIGAVLAEAEESAAVTHNHPEGIKGAKAVAAAVFLARTGSRKPEILAYIEKTFGYNLRRKIDEIRPTYSFDETCPGSVPEAIIAFIESTGYEDAVRKAVSLGGDSDTQACIAGAIAEAFYGAVPPDIVLETRSRLDGDLLKIADDFEVRFK
jgi:ADP-ribosylglycohydrolase